jgi:hypothetical protein
MGEALAAIANEWNELQKNERPEVVVQHGQHRLSIRYEVLHVNYNPITNRIEFVTGEQK